MGIAFRVLWAAFKGYYEEMFTLAGVNLLWVAIVLGPFGLGYLASYLLPVPLIVGVVLLGEALLVPPATAGVFYLTNHIAHHKRIESGMFFEGAKKFAVKSWLLTLLNLLAVGLCYVNFWFYGGFEGQWTAIVRGIFLVVGVAWLLIQMYVYPMLFEQEEPKLRLALRNATFMALASPFITLCLGVLMVLVAALSIGLTLPFAVAMMAVLGLMANEAVLALLIKFGIRKPPEEAVEG